MDSCRWEHGSVPGRAVGPLAELPSQQGGCGVLRNGLQRGQKSQDVTLTVIITLETHPKQTHPKQIPEPVGETSLARPREVLLVGPVFSLPSLWHPGSSRLLQALCQQLEFLHRSGFVEAFSALSFWHFSFAGSARQRWHNMLESSSQHCLCTKQPPGTRLGCSTVCQTCSFFPQLLSKADV